MTMGNVFPNSVDVLTKSLSFAEARHRIIANNIANANTPFYKAQRAPVEEFQQALSRAIERAQGGERVELQDTKNVSFDKYGMEVTPVEAGGDASVLRHDENNVSLEKEMAALAENTLMYRTMSDLLRKQFSLMRMAVSERVG
jgi:flagellar basal-body rod protein FlgB